MVQAQNFPFYTCGNQMLGAANGSILSHLQMESLDSALFVDLPA